jgi:hypothetical protein
MNPEEHVKHEPPLDDDEEKYTCQFCGYAFADKDKLHYYEFWGGPESPYKEWLCEICATSLCVTRARRDFLSSDMICLSKDLFRHLNLLREEINSR